MSCVTESKTSPSVFPLSLSRQESEGYVVIGCLVQGFFPPEPVNVTWNAGKDSTSVKNFPPVKAATGSLYTMSSQLTLPASQCPADSSVKCQVQHASSPSTAVSVPCKGQRAGWGGAGAPHPHSDPPPGAVSPRALHGEGSGLLG